MEIKLMESEIRYFKGIRHFSYSPNGENVTITAENRKGKTSLYDTVLWCLFDKDSEDRMP